MPDISKCTNNKCSLRNKCYRFTSLSSGVNQSYTEFNPIVDNEKEFCCHYYIDADDRLGTFGLEINTNIYPQLKINLK